MEGGTMEAVWIGWAVSAGVLILAAAWVGKRSKGTYFGFLLDERNQYSLSKFQVTLWTVLVISLIGGVVVGRISDSVDPLDFSIPSELLLVMGISLGSAAAATAVKVNVDNRVALAAARAGRTAPNPQPVGTARFGQMLSVEVGGVAKLEEIDLTKFQNFWFTLILVASYIALVVDTFGGKSTPSQITDLPMFNSTFVTLLAISHAAYLAGKLPTRLAPQELPL
jgi:hypothetical protein